MLISPHRKGGRAKEDIMDMLKSQKVQVCVGHPDPDRPASLPPILEEMAKEKAREFLPPQPPDTFLKVRLYSSLGKSLSYQVWWEAYHDDVEEEWDFGDAEEAWEFGGT